MEEYNGKPVEYWKKNAEENYLTTPISVLKYITVLEEKVAKLRNNADVSSPSPTCVDCLKSDDTVKDRGPFNGMQCYECKKNQDIEDEECR